MKRNNIVKIVFILVLLAIYVNPGRSDPPGECSEVWPDWAEIMCEIKCDLKHKGCKFWGIWNNYCDEGQWCCTEWDIYCYDGFHDITMPVCRYDSTCPN